MGKSIQGTAYANQQAVSRKIYTPRHICWNNHGPPPLPALLHDSLQDGIETMMIYNTGRGRGAKDHHRYSSGRSVLAKYVAECGIIIN